MTSVDAVPVRHVLLDADGVLQDTPGGYVALAADHLGDDALSFLEAFWAQEGPALCGEADFRDLLGRHLAGHPVGTTLDRDAFYRDVWLRIDRRADSLAVVADLRRAGYACHLGTNQEAHRAAYMRSELGYDAIFDVSCYSCDLGVVKPDPRYFERALRLIGAPAAEVCFVDDRADNVASARSVGLAGVRWTFTEGVDVLRSRLASAGVRLPA